MYTGYRIWIFSVLMVCESTHNFIEVKEWGSVPIIRNQIRRILKKYIVWVNAVVLWKKSYSVSSITFLVRTFCYC